MQVKKASVVPMDRRAFLVAATVACTRKDWAHDVHLDAEVELPEARQRIALAARAAMAMQTTRLGAGDPGAGHAGGR